MALFGEVKAFLGQIQHDNGSFSMDSAEKIVVAVSGGPDSLTLLHLFTIRQLHPAENVIVAHLDHQLRPSSAAEAERVCQFAAEWGAICEVGRVDVAALAEEGGLSIEEAGRKARYRFLAEVAGEYGASAIFTGHHAGDQAETVLMHFLRGSGLAGLRGILPVSPLGGYPGLMLVRPLLNISREEIEDYCQRHLLQPIMDESNTDTTFYRNRLRHELLPILEQYNPRIQERLLAMAAVISADFGYLEQKTAEAWSNLYQASGAGWLRFDLAGWQGLPLSLRRGTLRLAVGALRPNLRDVGFETVEQARKVAEKGVVGSAGTLPGDMRLAVGYDYLALCLADVELPLPALPQLLSDEPVPLPVPGRLELANGWVLAADWVTDVDLAEIEGNDDPWIAFLNVVDVNKLVVRPRLAGERFWPLGMNGRSKSVKSLMVDRKIPAELRPRWPIVADDHLFWIPGHAMDERVKVGAESHQVLKLSLEQL